MTSNVNAQSISIPFSKNGIDFTKTNDSNTARLLQNIVPSIDGSGSIRYGTHLETKILSTAVKQYNDIIHGCTHLNEDGTSQLLLYCTYYIQVPYINNTNITLAEIDDVNTRVTLNITALTANQKIDIKKNFFDGLSIRVVQVGDVEARDITNVTVTENNIIFDINFGRDFFVLNPDNHANAFNLWFERAEILKTERGVIIGSLKDDLDANVIVSSATFQQYTIFCNGVDPVLIYDGTTCDILTSPVKLRIVESDPITLAVVEGNSVITFYCDSTIRAEYTTLLTIDLALSIGDDANNEEELNIQAVTLDADAGGKFKVTLTCDLVAGIEEIRYFTYPKEVPKFSFITVGKKRLWALAQGRSILNTFRERQYTQLVYYAQQLDDPFSWFSEKTNEVDFIDLSTNLNAIDNLEYIAIFQGYFLFIGRRYTHIYSGDDPNTDEPIKEAADFKLIKVVNIGVLQRNLIQELPNQLALLGNTGKSYVFYLNEYGHISETLGFIAPIELLLAPQISSVITDREYRQMASFSDTYNDYIGFKIKNECLIFSNRNSGFWTIFTENFAEAKTFIFDNTNRQLYLGMSNGFLLSYADKVFKKKYTDYDILAEIDKKISFRYQTHNFTIERIYQNRVISLDLRSNSDFYVNVIISNYNDEIRPIVGKISVQQRGFQLDEDILGVDYYSQIKTYYPRTNLGFDTNKIMIELNGYVDSLFLLERIILEGGSN